MAAKTKYGKCIHTKDLVRRISHYTGSSLLAHDGELDADCSIGYHCVAKPMSFDFAHTHKFPEMLCFIGGRAEDITDFGAEIEFTLGGEKHLINTPAVVSIPAGVKHCPIVFKKVIKPLVFLEISLTRIWEPGRRRPPQKETAKPTKKTAAKASKKSGATKRSK
jgi:mannose-6-phosphate isomerase-like protein (cupin superfamily)